MKKKFNIMLCTLIGVLSACNEYDFDQEQYRNEVGLLSNSQMWAEAMEIYRSGRFKLAFSPAMQRYLKEHQRDFMPEDTKAGMIQAYLDKYTGSMVCSKQLYKEALNHTFDEPKQWEIREINEIMNQSITGWRYFPNPRMFSEYGRQKGWERENPATDSGNPSEKTTDGFVEVTEQMELPF